MKDIIELERDGIIYSAIRLGGDDFGLPKHLMTGEKKEGIIIDGDRTERWFWQGMCSYEGSKYAYFDRCDIESLETITTIHRDKALRIVLNIAKGIHNAPKDFINLETGVFPLYRIFIIDGEKVLLLPPDLGDTISIMRDEEERMHDVNFLIKKDVEMPFLLILEMAELMYYAASGMLPYQSEDVRLSNFEEAPLSAFCSFNEKTMGFIDFILHARNREMRDIMGNRGPAECLTWFIERAEGLVWDLGSISEQERDGNLEKVFSTESYRNYISKRAKDAKRRTFWRVRGALIVAIAAVAIVAGSIGGTMLKGFLEPPLTKDLEPAGIIEAFYQSQNEIDPQGLVTALKGTKAPQEMEVVNMFVSNRTRLANESFDSFVPVDQWIENGKPAVYQTSVIYGVVLDSIERISDDTYRATGTWYTPYSYEEEEDVDYTSEVQKDYSYVTVYSYKVSQDFTFKWNSRGWYNIVNIENTYYEYLGEEKVETKPLRSMMDKMADQLVDTQS
ncbi:MAG: hypothetical protein SPJ34_09215 [Candidatus Ornithospirochaeta sp.]|nr:hypothetical protein [Candidatus Ornithospirochaeta sp.]